MNFRLLLAISIATVLIVAISKPVSSAEPQRWRKQVKEVTIDTIITNVNGQGNSIEIYIKQGPEHNHPLMAVWVADENGVYLQTIYVSRSIATGTFNYGDDTEGHWQKGPRRRPAALPYWSHQRAVVANDGLYIPAPENPIPDAYSGPTPKNSVVIFSKMDEPATGRVQLFLEINQPWDWNEYWTNGKYPGNEEYASSAQPSVVYAAMIDLDKHEESINLEIVGHGHYAGESGKLFEDTSTLTTAKHIVESIIVKVK